ncbi:MAG: 4-(cytidine 5'-diphospho)-2-C-methyl-D-erythritol kinase [Aestuariivirga sp.]
MLDHVEERAAAKVNLSLHVLGRRVDGYHELDSIVGFADVADRLIIKRSSENHLAVSGPFASEVPLGDDNIVWKTWNTLNELREIPKVSVELEKNLPVASGIGGGSADAAAMLRGLLKLSATKLDDKEIKTFARSLGADVPVCYYGKSCQMSGIGETISTLNINLPAVILLVNPRKPCETAAVFKAMRLQPGETNATAPSSLEHGAWRNDMTVAAISIQPVIADVLAALAETSLQSIRMSGSGATCFGLANSMAEVEAAASLIQAQYPQWWIKPARLL